MDTEDETKKDQAKVEYARHLRSCTVEELKEQWLYLKKCQTEKGTYIHEIKNLDPTGKKDASFDY